MIRIERFAITGVVADCRGKTRGPSFVRVNYRFAATTSAGIVVVIWVFDVDDDAAILDGFSGGFDEAGVLRVAMDYGLAVEEKLADVGVGGGVAAPDAAMREVPQDIGEEEIYVLGSGEISRAVEERRSYRCGVLFAGELSGGALLGLGFGASVEGAEHVMVGRPEYAATAACGDVVLAECLGLGLGRMWLSSA